MSLCANGLKAVRKIWNEISPELEIAIEKVTEITGKIKDLEANPTAIIIENALAGIPVFAEVKGWLDVALTTITGVTGSAKTLEEKISEWLNGKTPLAINGDLLKLASTAVAVSDNNSKNESTYDSAVQLHIIVNKAA